ncbi:HNH endonuclease [Enhydrobacter aerosaccus]|uniref:HNH endonuclease n=1 Tax=Enhydrobacter aerosaccus TaxID=225324 RepID=A0A1T4PBI7_9HYPH|nr:HNH endonuclease [Enhydrobacter aerosaccus]SJZ88872.1 HNH endonuclease [Enhydrobacter aerosaccus]
MPRSSRSQVCAIRFRPRDTPLPTLIADLRRIARRHRRRRLTISVYGRCGRFATTTILRRFGSWNAALEAAELPIGQQWAIPDGELLQNLDSVWRKLGRQPTGREMTKKNGFSRFSLSTYKKRFGNWHAALKAFARFRRRPTVGTTIHRHKPRALAVDRRIRTPRTISWRLRATVLIRDNCLCRMCGASPAKDPAVTLHVDHIKPWSKGGPTTLDNLQTLCSVCNIGKSDLPAGA